MFTKKNKQAVVLTSEQLTKKFDKACGNVLRDIRKEASLLMSRDGVENVVNECRTFSGMMLKELLTAVYGEDEATTTFLKTVEQK